MDDHEDVASKLTDTLKLMTTDSTDTLYADTLNQLHELFDERVLIVNQRHGDGHGVNLSKLRAIAKDLKKNQELAVQLWASADSAARLLSLLICRPREFSTDELDIMLYEARTPKVTDWLINYVVKKHPGWNELRLRWLDNSSDPQGLIRAAGWSLNTYAITKAPESLDLEKLLKSIESDMASAPGRLQWSMNETLANIGIEFPEHRERAIGIGEHLGVLRDYPTPPNCTSPFAPIWIAELVRREESE